MPGWAGASAGRPWAGCRGLAAGCRLPVLLSHVRGVWDAPATRLRSALITGDPTGGRVDHQGGDWGFTAGLGRVVGSHCGSGSGF
jgi:hypothetical protein